MYKTLKHKTLPDTYCYLTTYNNKLFSGESSTPTLQPMTATEKDMRELYKSDKEVIDQVFNDYSLIEVEVRPL